MDVLHHFKFFLYIIPQMINLTYCFKVPPQIMPFFFGEEPTNFGESTAVNCMITKGDLPLAIQWSLNGEPLNTNENYGITIVRMNARLSSLNIESINQRHRGVFECMATNMAGTVQHTAQLIVNGT